MQMQDEARDLRRDFLADVFKAWDKQGKKMKFLAALMGVDPVMISYWKTGIRGISERNLQTLCITVGYDRTTLGKRPYTMREFKPRRKRSA